MEPWFPRFVKMGPAVALPHVHMSLKRYWGSGGGRDRRRKAALSPPHSVRGRTHPPLSGGPRGCPGRVHSFHRGAPGADSRDPRAVPGCPALPGERYRLIGEYPLNPRMGICALSFLTIGGTWQDIQTQWWKMPKGYNQEGKKDYAYLKKLLTRGHVY